MSTSIVGTLFSDLDTQIAMVDNNYYVLVGWDGFGFSKCYRVRDRSGTILINENVTYKLYPVIEWRDINFEKKPILVGFCRY